MKGRYSVMQEKGVRAFHQMYRALMPGRWDWESRLPSIRSTPLTVASVNPDRVRINFGRE